jgi:hypothetical protein
LVAFILYRFQGLSAITSNEGMHFEEATFGLGSDVQTRQSRGGRIVSHENEGHQEVVRGTLELQIKAVDHGGAPIYVVSEGEPSIFTELVHSIHIFS